MSTSRVGGKPEYIDEILQTTTDFLPGSGGQSDDADGEVDALYDDAVRVVTETRRASISGVQRRLKIGYNRAARMIEQMEASGVVGPQQTNGNREVLGATATGGITPMISQALAMKTLVHLLCSALWLAACANQRVFADDLVTDYFSGLDTFQSQFIQTVIDSDGQQIQRSEGTVWIRKPGRFRWDYQTPYRQLIVADGKQLWDL